MPISYADSLCLPENRFEEIVRGEIRLIPLPDARHAFLIHALARQLDFDQHVVMTSPFGLGIERDPLTYRVPDLAVFAVELLRRDLAQNDPRDPYIWKPPELLAECLSPSHRKGSIEELLQDYGKARAAEVWLFHPQQRILAAWALEGDALRESYQVSSGNLSPQRFPGVKIDLHRLWRVFHEGL